MKRFTDTELWKKPWFMDLTPTEKLAFFYIKDHCDNVGVWTPNFRLAEFIIGSQLDWDKFAGKCHDNIFIMENGKWWLIDFCTFQHPDFIKNPDGGKSNALTSYVNLLRSHGLYDLFTDYIDALSKGVARAYPCPQGISKGKGKGKGKRAFIKKLDETHPLTHLSMNKTTYEELTTEYGKPTVDDYFQRIADYCSANGKAYKDSAAACRNWIKKDIDAGKFRRLSNRDPDGIVIAQKMEWEV